MEGKWAFLVFLTEADANNTAFQTIRYEIGNVIIPQYCSFFCFENLNEKFKYENDTTFLWTVNN